MSAVSLRRLFWCDTCFLPSAHYDHPKATHSLFPSPPLKCLPSLPSPAKSASSPASSPSSPSPSISRSTSSAPAPSTSPTKGRPLSHIRFKPNRTPLRVVPSPLLRRAGHANLHASPTALARWASVFSGNSNAEWDSHLLDLRSGWKVRSQKSTVTFANACNG